jgi:hypothetical protein
MGEQHDAACLFLQPADARWLGADGELQPIADGLDRTGVVGTGAAPAIHGPFLHGDLHPMGGGGHGAELRRCGVRIRVAEVLRLLRGPDGALHRAIRGLDVPCQPLLPPVVLRAGVHHHSPIGRPGAGALARRGLIGRSRTGLGRLRVGEDADLLPGVVRHGLGDAPPALVLGGGEAGDEQGVAQRCQVVCCHQCRIRDVDVCARRYPVLPQERR